MTYEHHRDNIEIVMKENDVVVKDNFVIGILDLEMMTQLELPLFMTLVQMNDFVRHSTS